jgi:hypothetical protein
MTPRLLRKVTHHQCRLKLMEAWVLLRGARSRLATGEAFCRASLCEVLCVGKVFGFNHKIMINV